MHKRKAFGSAILLASLLAMSLRAQVPSVPGVPPPPTIPSTPSVPAAATAVPPPSNIWSKLCPTAAQLAACKQKFCNSAFGKMFTAMTMPLSIFTAGLFGSCCPTTPFGQFGPGTPDGTASKIAADEANAKARRADMRYLGTVDCHYWPEAEAALIAGLRTDKNECVRWEAAISLGKGCCCTKKTIEALRLVVTGSEKDGNPAETSDRVKAAAMSALQHCLCCYREKAPEVPKEKPLAANPPAQPLLPAYYGKLDSEPAEPIVAEARQLLARIQKGEAGRLAVLPTGSRSVSHVLAKANDPKTFPDRLRPPTLAGNATSAKAGALRPVPAATPEAPARRDLYHWLKDKWQQHGTIWESSVIVEEPPLAEVSEPKSPVVGPPTAVPPSGKRDLLNVLRSSLTGQ